MIVNQALLWIILGVCFFLFCLGFIYRISMWLKGEDENGSRKRPRIARFFSYLGQFLKALFSAENNPGRYDHVQVEFPGKVSRVSRNK